MAGKNQEVKYIPISLTSLLVGEPLPAALYIYVDLRYLTFRVKGDILDRSVFERLEARRAKNIFILSGDEQKFKDWKTKLLAKTPPPDPKTKEFNKAKQDVHRSAMDIFQSEYSNQAIKKAVEVSKKLASQVLALPYSTVALTQLQTFSSNVAHHSTNVSVLSSYLALQMGYSNLPILQNVAMGGLFHDIGKTKVELDPLDTPESSEKKMEEHPLLGVEILQSAFKNVPQEVLLIVAQHHECHDGSGYPKKMRGNSIYDLAKIVSIANTFDGLVAESSGSLQERQKKAVRQLAEVLFFNKFEADKHEKAIRILDLGV